jgi:hypothetical protein
VRETVVIVCYINDPFVPILYLFQERTMVDKKGEKLIEILIAFL